MNNIKDDDILTFNINPGIVKFNIENVKPGKRKSVRLKAVKNHLGKRIARIWKPPSEIEDGPNPFDDQGMKYLIPSKLFFCYLD